MLAVAQWPYDTNDGLSGIEAVPIEYKVTTVCNMHVVIIVDGSAIDALKADKVSWKCSVEINGNNRSSWHKIFMGSSCPGSRTFQPLPLRRSCLQVLLLQTFCFRNCNGCIEFFKGNILYITKNHLSVFKGMMCLLKYFGSLGLNCRNSKEKCSHTMLLFT